MIPILTYHIHRASIKYYHPCTLVIPKPNDSLSILTSAWWESSINELSPYLTASFSQYDNMTTRYNDSRSGCTCTCTKRWYYQYYQWTVTRRHCSRAGNTSSSIAHRAFPCIVILHFVADSMQWYCTYRKNVYPLRNISMLAKRQSLIIKLASSLMGGGGSRRG